MGCDIHTCYERRVGGYWELYDWETACNDDYDVLFEHPLYIGRSYALFGALAGVREHNVAHLPVRDFPSDASDGTRKAYDEWNGDAHTPTYATLEELKAFDWNSYITRKGLVNGPAYRAYERDGHQDSWCGGVSGNGIEHVSEAELRRRLTAGETCEKVYTQIQWRSPLTVNGAVKHFRDVTVPEMERLSLRRLVFWFDN